MYTMNTVPTPSPRSPWHSPVPYLFGGLAAMLGLIAFALLILACSYYKLSGYLENDESRDPHDLELGEGHGYDEKPIYMSHYIDNIVVIMAGQEKPTFLATQASNRASTLIKGSNIGDEAVVVKVEGEGEGEKMEEEKLRIMERHETSI